MVHVKTGLCSSTFPSIDRDVPNLPLQASGLIWCSTGHPDLSRPRTTGRKYPPTAPPLANISMTRRGPLSRLDDSSAAHATPSTPNPTPFGACGYGTQARETLLVRPRPNRLETRGNRQERFPEIEQEPSRRATCRLRDGTTFDALRIRRTPPLHTPSLGKRRRFDPRNEGGTVQEGVGRLRSSPADRRRLKPIPERSRKTDGKDRKTSPYLRDTRLRAQEGDLKGGF